jgi:DNA-binding response OmpR family regulator
MRVLVVEDYTPLRESVTCALEEAGYAVDAAADGHEGLWHALSAEHDAIVLDIMLPGLDGLAVLSRLRAEGHPTPVLLLTAKDTVADRVRGLDAGADDYRVKPFALLELLAWVRALVRRGKGVADPTIRVGDLAVDTAGRAASRGGRNLDLTAREYAVLELLALRAGKVVSREEVWRHVYDFAAEIESNVVDVYIGYLRRKTEAGGGTRLIHTRRGQGYVLQP